MTNPKKRKRKPDTESKKRKVKRTKVQQSEVETKMEPPTDADASVQTPTEKTPLKAGAENPKEPMYKKGHKGGGMPILDKKRLKIFLNELRKSPSVTRACRVAKVSRSAVYGRKAKDPSFAKAWKNALDDGISDLEASAFKRAAETSDVLAIFLLKAHKPERYMERQDITSGGKSLANPIKTVEVRLPSGPDEDEEE